MNKKEFLAYHRHCIDLMHQITQAKNADYTGSTDDPFKNFRIVEELGICSVETGFLTRMSDKFSRLKSLTVDGNACKVKDESVEDTLFDLANYCILMASYLKSKQQTLGDCDVANIIDDRISHCTSSNAGMSRCPGDT